MAAENMATQMLDNAEDVLRQLDADPKAQVCLKLYQRIPDKEKGTFNLMLDAFIRGFTAGQMANK
jgi:hypothetical protein